MSKTDVFFSFSFSLHSNLSNEKDSELAIKCDKNSKYMIIHYVLSLDVIANFQYSCLVASIWLPQRMFKFTLHCFREKIIIKIIKLFTQLLFFIFLIF